MRLPYRQIAGQLLFTTDGQVWAIWRCLSADNQQLGPDQAAADAALLRALPAQAMIASLCPQTNPADIVRAMIRDVDLLGRPAWVETCVNVLDQLLEVDLTGRTHWLAVPLVGRTSGSSLRGSVNGLGGRLGIGQSRVPAAEITRARQQAEHLAATWPGGRRLRPAREAEIYWWLTRAPRRGLDEPTLPGEPDDPVTPGQLVALDDVIYDEGGRSDLTGADRVRPRRLLKTSTESGDSYQCLLALTAMPARWLYPGSAWLANLDEFGFPIDWVARIKVESNARAETKTRRRSRHLADQHQEWGADTAGPPPELAAAQEQLDEERVRLSANATEVELQVATVLAVWGPGAQSCEERAEALRNAYAATQFQLARPVGEQTTLYEAMLPGIPTSRVVRAYSQYLLARDLALCGPMVSGDIGDDSGGLLGFARDGAGARPVLYDPTWGSTHNAPTALAAVAELGAGKSVVLKKVAFEVLARVGGRVIAVDRTPAREYAKFLEVCPGTTEAVDVGGTARVSLDPLRIFPRTVAARRATTFLTALLDLIPSDAHGVALEEVIYAVAADGGTCADLIAALETRKTPEAQLLGRRMLQLAGKDLARTIFDPTLPALDLVGTDAIVFTTASVQLPTRAEIRDPYQAARLTFEKQFGRAIYLLLCAICRDVAFAERDRFCLVVKDETWADTLSSDGEAFNLELVRDGRKHAAGAAFGAHDPDDLGSEALQGLIAMRMVGRIRDRTLAAKALRWLNRAPDDPELLSLVRGDAPAGLSPLDLPEQERRARAGEFLVRDQRDRCRPVKVLIPPYRALAEAIDSTPRLVPAFDESDGFGEAALRNLNVVT